MDALSYFWQDLIYKNYTMGRKKKKNKNNPYILEHMTEDDQRIGSLVDQGESVTISKTNVRQTTNTNVDINL